MHGNYLKRSIRAAGLDPDNLPESDPSKMNFGAATRQEGLEGHLGLRPGHRRGQGRCCRRAELVARLTREYAAARMRRMPADAQAWQAFGARVRTRCGGTVRP